MDFTNVIPAFVVALIWGLRELIPVLGRELRRRRDSERPVPLMREQMPTPDYTQAGRSGQYHAVAYDQASAATGQYVTRAELAAVTGEIRDTLTAIVTRLEQMQRDVGRIEGVLEHVSPIPRPPRPPRPGR